MPEVRRPLPVWPSDLESLQASGLSRNTIRANGIYTEDDPVKLATLLNRLPERPPKQIKLFIYFGGLVFPYRSLSGELYGFARVRPHHPRILNGKPCKYEQPWGSTLRAYFPFASLDKLRDGTSPIYITEGEKKALALSQLGLVAIGLGGIWGGCKKGSPELIDDLAAITWTDRDVYIVFDYDAKASTRREAEQARIRLARALKARGAGEVYYVELPPGPNGAKQGVDDFLVAQGADAFNRLVAQAIPVIKIISGIAGERGGIPVTKIISPPVLGEAAYHGPIGRFLRDVSPHTEATDAGILAHLLPALGVYMGNMPYIFAGTNHYARVNTVLVGPTSTGRKGTALAPVDLLMERVDPKFWNDQRVGGLSTGEGLVAKVADKTTVDKDGNVTIIPVEKRLYVVEEEFSKVLAQLRREGNILSQVLRESYDSGNLSVLTRKNPLQAFGAHISITGHITPEELIDRFNHIEMANGFGNRFLWFVVKSDKILPRCQPIPESVFESFVSCVKQARNLAFRIAFREGYVSLAHASMGKWEREIYPSLREDKPGFAGALVARGSSMVLRLALIYFLLDPPPKGVSQGITPVHLDAALAVWRYCEESVQILFKSRTGTFLVDKILGLLANGPMTKDQINDHLSPKQKEEVAGVLTELEAAGSIRKSTDNKPGAGRPATVWELAN